jgi:RNA polymerase sigma-70 factor (ECF subfamily)
MNLPSDFDKLVENHSAEIFAYLWRLLQDTADAEDCLQETYFRAFRSINHLRSNSNYRAWLYKIATNIAYTHLKRRQRTQSLQVHLDPGIIASDYSSTVEMEHSNLMIAVRQAVEQLPQKQQAALMMRKYQGLNYIEIANALDCSPQAARANVYQALKKLRIQFLNGENS